MLQPARLPMPVISVLISIWVIVRFIIAATIITVTKTTISAVIKNRGHRRNRHGRSGHYGSGGYNPGYADPYRGNYRTHEYRLPKYRSGRRHNVCGPRRAVKKAYRLGLNNPQVHRIKDRRIVVTGYQYGYRTKMVFKRYSNCNLIKTVNFNR